MCSACPATGRLTLQFAGLNRRLIQNGVNARVLANSLIVDHRHIRVPIKVPIKVYRLCKRRILEPDFCISLRKFNVGQINFLPARSQKAFVSSISAAKPTWRDKEAFTWNFVIRCLISIAYGFCMLIEFQLFNATNSMHFQRASSVRISRHWSSREAALHWRVRDNARSCQEWVLLCLPAPSVTNLIRDAARPLRRMPMKHSSGFATQRLPWARITCLNAVRITGPSLWRQSVGQFNWASILPNCPTLHVEK